jgi:hypothetical protein
MKKRTLEAHTFLLLGCLLVNACSGKKGANEGGSAPVSPAAATSANQKLSPEELQALLARIALYPDPLLAQIVPASTFIDQLQEANRVLAGKSDDNLIADQNWDVSVKSVAHYPEVLDMMVEDSEWTTTLGQAYVTEPDEVGNSIQELRAEASAAGNLQTTPQQEVITEGEVIRIEPAQPQVIYVPQYDPEVVYVESGPSTGEVVAASLISFGAGLAIGAWLNNDWDYGGQGVYYHGWSGGGWVGVNRSYVDVNRNVYVNNSFRQVNVNRNIVSRNTASYRTNLNREATVRRERVNARSNVGSGSAGRPGGLPNTARPNAPNRDLARPSGTGAVGKGPSGAARSRSDVGGGAARNNPSSARGGATARAGSAGGAAKSRPNRASAASKPSGGGGGAKSRPSGGGGGQGKSRGGGGQGGRR